MKCKQCRRLITGAYHDHSRLGVVRSTVNRQVWRKIIICDPCEQENIAFNKAYAERRDRELRELCDSLGIKVEGVNA